MLRRSFSFALLAAFTLPFSLARGEVTEAVNGTYFGLIQGSSFAGSGYVRVRLNREGRGSVSVKLGNEANCVLLIGPGGGGFGGAGGDMSVQLRRFIAVGGAPVLEGTVTDEGQTFPVTLALATPPTDLATLPGDYTLFLATQPVGTVPTTGLAGMGRVHVSKGGGLRFAARLADGSVLTQGAKIDAAGAWTLFAKAGRRAAVSGEVKFADLATSDFSGTPLLQPAAAAAAQTALVLRGSKFDAAAGFSAAAMWSLNTTAEAGQTTPFSAELTAKNRRLVSLGANRAALFLNADDGRIFGGYGTSFADARVASGVIFQKTGDGIGFTSKLDGSARGIFTVGALTLSGNGVVKTGSGTLTLSGGNTSSGGTTVNGGTLTLNGGTLTGGSGATTINAGGSSLNFNGGAGVTLVNAGALTVSSSWSQQDPATVAAWLAGVDPTRTPALPLGDPRTNATVGGASLTLVNPGTLEVSNAWNLPVSTGRTLHVVGGNTLPAATISQLTQRGITFVFGNGADAVTYTSAELQTLIDAAHTAGQTTLVLSGVTLAL